MRIERKMREFYRSGENGKEKEARKRKEERSREKGGRRKTRDDVGREGWVVGMMTKAR